MPGEERSRWQGPFWLGATADAVGTLIALVIVAVLGIVAKVSVGDLLLYGGVPLLLVGLVVLAMRVRRTVGNKVADWETWLADTNRYLTDVAAHLRRLHLQDVIETAQALRWKVLDAGRSLEFESPEGEDEVFVVHSRHDIVDRWVCVVAASTSFLGSAVNASAAEPSPEGEV